jgi:hypothetical protein
VLGQRPRVTPREGRDRLLKKKPTQDATKTPAIQVGSSQSFTQTFAPILAQIAVSVFEKLDWAR